MIIVFVCDSFLTKTDGTSFSAYRFRQALQERGHCVRVITCKPPKWVKTTDIMPLDKDIYCLDEHYVPIATPVATFNNQYFAKFDAALVTQALEGADVVHFYFPWQSAKKIRELAVKKGIPTVGGFHVQPENVSYNMMRKYFEPLNQFLYLFFKEKLYGHLDNIHCPSAMIAHTLRSHRYSARLHVFSNGVSNRFIPSKEPRASHGDTINVLMIGRIAEEKRQDLIIKAVKFSKYEHRIQLYFNGTGPMEKRFKRQSAKLSHQPVFGFLPHDKLLERIYDCDIYIHASDAEIEGIGCIEAFSCGKVPIISDSKKSAASQFAIDRRSLFKKGDYLDLRDKLDYWIEHPEERRQMEIAYARQGELYKIAHSVTKMEELYQAALRDYKTERLFESDKALRRYVRMLEDGYPVFKPIKNFFYYVIIVPLLTAFTKIFFGLKVENRRAIQKIKKSGAITICNHIHFLDCVICATRLFPHRPLIASLPSNLRIPVAGWFVHAFAVPTPRGPKEMQAFMYAISKQLRKHHFVHLYPEGERFQYREDLAPFQRGAFYLASDAGVPVLPMCLTTRENRGLYKLLKKKPCLTLRIGEPIFPEMHQLKRDAAAELQEKAEIAMRELLKKPFS
jgi:1-acyl-sn-glycerol-3-phosphate acyltransferase